MRTKPADIPYCGCRVTKVATAQPTLWATKLHLFHHYVTERYTIHLLKDVYDQPKPWTDDPILQQFRFTNIRREHDRETKWYIQNIAQADSVSYDSKLLNTILFRLFNKHETAELLKLPQPFADKPWKPESYRLKFVHAQIADPSYVFFTGAFNTGGVKVHCRTYMPKDVPDLIPLRMLYFLRHMQDDGIVSKIQAATNQAAVVQTLMSYDGLGPFLAYQVYVDYTYIKEFPFSENEYTVAGPGCRSGLDILFKDKDGMTYEECLFWLRDNLDIIFKTYIDYQWDPNKLFVDLPKEDRCFNVMSLENIFCEFSKYVRAYTGTGRPRKTYKGGTSK